MTVDQAIYTLEMKVLELQKTRLMIQNQDSHTIELSDLHHQEHTLVNEIVNAAKALVKRWPK